MQLKELIGTECYDCKYCKYCIDIFMGVFGSICNLCMNLPFHKIKSQRLPKKTFHTTKSKENAHSVPKETLAPLSESEIHRKGSKLHYSL